MGLFDQVFGGMAASHEFTAKDGFAGVMLGAIACDGHIADEEVTGLWTILSRMKLFESNTPQQFGQMMDRLVSVLKREGVDILLQRSAEVLPPELKETAFANACDLVLADGIVDPAEKDFLNNLMKTLSISGDKALTIVEVMIMKNRG